MKRVPLVFSAGVILVLAGPLPVLANPLPSNDCGCFADTQLPISNTFTVTPNPVIISKVGDTATATLDLILTLEPFTAKQQGYTVDYTTGAFTGGKITLDSGNGQSSTTYINNIFPKPVLSPLDISATFKYNAVGTYTPSYYEYDITFYETGTYSYTQTTYKKVETCSWHNGHEHCSDSWVPIQTTVTKTVKTTFEECYDSGSQSLSVTIVDTTLTPTPLPGALPLFTSGLGALGFLGWRRKRQKPAAVAGT